MGELVFEQILFCKRDDDFISDFSSLSERPVCLCVSFLLRRLYWAVRGALGFTDSVPDDNVFRTVEVHRVSFTVHGRWARGGRVGRAWPRERREERDFLDAAYLPE